MSSTRLRSRRANFSLNLLKHDVYKSSPPGSPVDQIYSALSPDPVPCSAAHPLLELNIYPNSRIRDYLLLGESSPSSRTLSVEVYEAFNIVTRKKFVCKVLPKDHYQELLAPYYRIGSHEHINQLHEVIVGETCVYAFFPHHFGDLHSHVRSARRLKDTNAAHLFAQIVSIIAHCHDSGVVVRDLKLRKFVFKDEEKTQLMLESLDDAYLLDVDTDDDSMSDRHGCPAYVSPEILAASNSTYSGRAADIWSLGVVLYTMLIGRYPFHDSDPVALFRLIRHGRYTIPRCAVSEQAECLIRWILRCDPNERPTASEILRHPWFDLCQRFPSRADRFYNKRLDTTTGGSTSGKDRDTESFPGSDANNDQIVPQESLISSSSEFGLE